MEFKTTREALLSSLELLKLSSGNVTDPATPANSVKIEAHEKAIYMFTYTMHSAMLKKLKGEVKGIGACVVHLGNLLDLTKKLKKDKPVKLVILEDGRLEVRQQRSRSKFSTFEVSKFPAFTYIKKEMYNPINPTDFRDAVQRISYCIDSDSMRKGLSGMLLDPVEEEDAFCRLVASDGHRLNIAKVLAVFESKVLVPFHAVQVILRAFKDEKDVGVFADENYFFFQSDDIYYNSRLISSPFPEYWQVFPKGDHMSIKVLRKDIIDAFERLVLFSKDTGTARVSVIGNKLEVRVRDKSAEALEEIDIIEETGAQPIEIGLNAQNILQAFKHFTESEITMRIYGAHSPISVKESVTEKIIMPVRL